MVQHQEMKQVYDAFIIIISTMTFPSNNPNFRLMKVIKKNFSLTRNSVNRGSKPPASE